jgi:hypothetical protein
VRAWRREPMTTLKTTVRNPTRPNMAPASHGSELRPNTRKARADRTMVPTMIRAVPTTRTDLPATRLPSTPPTAEPLSSSPNPTASSPSSSWANSTITALPPMASRLTTATMAAVARSTRWAASQRRPSAISERRVARRPPGPSSPGSGPKWPRMEATRAEPAANETASTANGTQVAAENRNPPAGGPASSWVTTWVPTRRPLAHSSRWASRDTSAGRIDCAPVSTSVCPVPSRNPTAASSAMLAWSSSTATASPPTTANRPASTTHITRRRSQRSSSAPLSRPNSSHGSHSAKLTSDTSSGSRVSVAASNGSAVPYTPSPRFETPDAAHSLLNPFPRNPLPDLGVQTSTTWGSRPQPESRAAATPTRRRRVPRWGSVADRRMRFPRLSTAPGTPGPRPPAPPAPGPPAPSALGLPGVPTTRSPGAPDPGTRQPRCART